mgnify:FL=1
MIRDITIGQYYPAESAIHKMDARLKLMITFVFGEYLCGVCVCYCLHGADNSGIEGAV